MGSATSYEYSKMDQIVKITNALSQTTKMSYDVMGSLTILTDNRGNQTHYKYDEMGQIVDRYSGQQVVLAIRCYWQGSNHNKFVRL